MGYPPRHDGVCPDKAVLTFGEGSCHVEWEEENRHVGEDDGEHGEQDWESVSADELDSEMPDVLDVTKSVLTISTQHWAEIDCEDPDCTDLFPHGHIAYDAEAPEKPRKVVEVRLCNRCDCPDATAKQLHAHQGSSWRGMFEFAEISTPRVRQGDVMPAVDGRVAVVVDEFDGRLPFDRYPCVDAGCKHLRSEPEHDHLRNVRDAECLVGEQDVGV